MAAGRDLVRRQERATPLSTNAEDLKIIPGDELGPERSGAAALAQANRCDARSHETRERAIVIAKVLVVGIGHRELTARRRFAEDGYQSRRPLDACERRQRDCLEHREDRGVQTDAERENQDNGERERAVLRERTNRVADVAHLIVQGVEPPRGPHASGRVGGQRDVAEVLARRELRTALVGAVGHALVGGDLQVRANLVLEVLVVEAPPLQPPKDRHVYSLLPVAAGFITRLMAFTSSVHRDSSRRSCFFPSGVRR